MPAPTSSPAQVPATSSPAHVLVLVLLLALVAPTPASAQDSPAGEPSRALVLAPVDDAVMERVRGQTADLSWSLQVVEDAGGASLSVARRAATAAGARAALWVSSGEGELNLWLFDARASRLLRRRFPVEPAGDAQALSAAREALALAVRASLRALEAGDALGEPVTGDAEGGVGGVGGVGSGSTGGGAGGAAPDDADEDVDEHDDEDVDVDLGDGHGSVGGRVAVGWQGALDGQSEPLQQGPWLGLALVFPAVELGVRGVYALSATVEDEHTELSLARHFLVGEVAVPFALAPSIDLVPALAGGVLHERRSTRATDASLVSTEDQASTTLALEASAALRGEMARGGFGAVGVSLSVGLLVTPRPTVLRYQLAAQNVDRKLWSVAPVARAGLYLQL